jgi:hypothetical protein
MLLAGYGIMSQEITLRIKEVAMKIRIEYCAV